MAVTVPSASEQITYEDLYARWERGHWRATEIDFSQDRVDWHERLTPQQRRGALWLYALFLHGEDSVTVNLSPYIDAASLDEQKYFLTTQQVDEARHAVFFSRFLHEVAGTGDGSLGGGRRATAPQVTWGHRQVFRRLDRMAAELRRDRSPRTLAAAVTLYHIVVEATLAQPGQHMIERYLEELDLLPGFRAGMRNLALDEQRHIGFGVKLLADLHRDDPQAIQDAIVDVIREVLPTSIAVARPPGFDRGYTECFGFTLEDLYEEGARSQQARLRAVGLPLDEIAHFPLPLELSPREQAVRAIKLLEAGIVGPRNGAPSRDPETMALFFDQIRRQVRGELAPAGTTIQWDFPDAEPWYLRLDGPDKVAAPGRVARPSLRLRMRFDDFVDLAARRNRPRALVLRGRLRPRGDVRLLARLPRLFG